MQTTKKQIRKQPQRLEIITNRCEYCPLQKECFVANKREAIRKIYCKIPKNYRFEEAPELELHYLFNPLKSVKVLN